MRTVALLPLLTIAELNAQQIWFVTRLIGVPIGGEESPGQMFARFTMWTAQLLFMGPNSFFLQMGPDPTFRAWVTFKRVESQLKRC